MSKEQDPFDLNRFVEAQAQNYEDALGELRVGKKTSHWSWYVLPQIRGLGSSPMSKRYALSGLQESEAYLGHPVLGARLRECIEALNAHDGLSANTILGSIDAKKLHSCVTLFARIAPAESPFHKTLKKYFDGAEDAATIAMIAS